MASELSLSTRTDVECVRCQSEYRLAEPTDALAERPVRVNVFCPSCGKTAMILLTERGARRASQFPAPAPHDEALPRHSTSVTLSANSDIGGGGRIARLRREVG